MRVGGHLLDGVVVGMMGFLGPELVLVSERNGGMAAHLRSDMTARIFLVVQLQVDCRVMASSHARENEVTVNICKQINGLPNNGLGEIFTVTPPLMQNDSAVWRMGKLRAEPSTAGRETRQPSMTTSKDAKLIRATR